MIEKRNVWLPVLLMIVFAITRWPGLMPPNFSAVYALVFCAGLYFRNRLGWWIPLSVMVLSDLLLNLFYYTPNGWGGWKTFGYQAMNYVAYAAIFWLGRRFKQTDSFVKTVCGGLAGGIIFYLITNTAAWLLNPFENREYHHDWKSWLVALTTGTSAWPGTWEFFRNTLLSSGLFAALFAAAMKYSEHLESAAEKNAANVPAESDEPEPESEGAKASS